MSGAVDSLLPGSPAVPGPAARPGPTAGALAPLPARAADHGRGLRLRAWREKFHRLPGRSGQEAETEAAILGELAGLGLPFHLEGRRPGLVVTLAGSDGPTLTVRAPIDALPVQEETGLACASTVPGVMHACGHDANIAVQLELARAFAADPPARGHLRLLFQPEEETLTGARHMLDSGTLALGPQDALCSFHLSPSLPLGRVGLAEPVALASVDDFTLELTGGGGHAGSPQAASDPILAASELIGRLPGLIRRRLDPRDVVTWTIGRLEAGTVRNVVAPRARLEGTLRYFEEAAAAAVRAALIGELQAVAVAHGLGAAHQFRTVVPSLRNDPALGGLFLETAAARLGAAQVDRLRPSLAADDAAYLHDRAPGVYWLVGCAAPEGPTPPLHSSRFDFPEPTLEIAFELLRDFTDRFFARRAHP